MIIENYQSYKELSWDEFIKRKYSLFLDAENELFISHKFAKERLGIDLWRHPKTYSFALCQDESINAVKVSDLLKEEWDTKAILLLIAKCDVYKLE